MDELIDILKARYETAINSKYDSLFYHNVYSYVDWIVKNPKLNSVLERMGNEYRSKHIKIWDGKTNTKEDSEERSRQTTKLERFDAYCFYTSLEVRIYWMLDEYYKTSEPDYAQNPCALLMMKGIKNIPRKEWSKLKNELPNRWSLSNLKMYNKWYEGQRKNYEIELKQFHTEFIAELTKTKDKNLPETKEQLIGFNFNPKTGDFSYYQTKGTIALGTNEFKIFSLLYGCIGNFVDHLTLSREMNTNITEVRKSHKDSLSQVIRNIKRKFGILPKTKTSNPDIFNSTPKAGYRLINKDK